MAVMDTSMTIQIPDLVSRAKGEFFEADVLGWLLADRRRSMGRRERTALITTPEQLIVFSEDHFYSVPWQYTHGMEYWAKKNRLFGRWCPNGCAAHIGMGHYSFDVVEGSVEAFFYSLGWPVARTSSGLSV